jgi:hypothetical protein
METSVDWKTGAEEIVVWNDKPKVGIADNDLEN